MPYLIDGHNLIGQLPDIDLADPDDEVKLVLKLRSFAGRVGKKVTVVFDNGLPAGEEKTLSTHSVRVRFASPRSSADQVLRNMIARLKNPRGWVLVCSDVAVTALAAQKGVRVITSHQFAQDLTSLLAAPRSAVNDEPSQKANPRLSQAEVDEWLSLFQAGGDD
ncbi:MAG: hypothetical protein GYB66_12510 [Chloroflexi bacterium]|nr:hypothetical protein [Chloroflexota bacterium]